MDSNIRWLKVIWPFLATAALLVAIGAFSMDVLSATRAYVGGEGLWSKAQKRAVLHLTQYVESGDPVHYEDFLLEIAVPLGDRKARLELDKKQPDYEVARQGFLEGRNHPDDIDGLVRLYRNFRNVSLMKEPIAIWRLADEYIAEIIDEAHTLHQAISSGSPDPAQLRATLERINDIDLLLTPLEEAFSNSLGQTTRTAKTLLLFATIAAAVTLMSFGGYISHTILARSERFERELRVVTAQAAAERERREADARIRDQAALLDNARDAIVVRDIDHRIRFWNKGAQRLYGWTAEEVLGQSIETLLYEPAAFREAFGKVLESGEWTGEIAPQRKDGSKLTIESHWTLVRNDSGEPQSIFAIDTDITARKAAEQEIQKLAFYDPLTQLPNRQLLLDRLQRTQAINARNRCTGALLFIDLDNFKTLNDTRGHDKGDLLLQQVAARLIPCVRESDTVARLGGDEFVVMLTDLNENLEEAGRQAKVVCTKILAALRPPYPIAGLDHHSTCSIGVALFNDRQSTVSELLKQADLAMYQAKAAGRNTVRFFSPDMQAAVNARADMEADLRQALEQNEFVLYYQPQVDGDRRMSGVEALLRWRHPRYGMVSPMEFMPLAEEMGLILPLGRWVLETACRQLADWASREETANLHIAVNISVRQFRHPDFVSQVTDALARTGASPDKLKLELTESLMVDDMESTIAKMTALKAEGVGFALDDFGTGYSSLAYLKRLPLEQLKIDRSFVRDVLTDPNDAAIARTIVALAQSLGLAVIAEGVETEEQREFLSRHGCHSYQGYLFGKPLPIEHFEAFIGDAWMAKGRISA